MCLGLVAGLYKRRMVIRSAKNRLLSPALQVYYSHVEAVVKHAKTAIALTGPTP